MATTVPLAFAQFRSALEITGLQESTVSTRQQAVRNAVARELEVIDSFLTGSYARHTLIAPLKEADIDVFVVLASKYYGQFRDRGQRRLLDALRAVLLKSYPSTPDISRNGQAVTIRFSDFIVDVVPAFNRQGGGYIIPNSVAQTWISTDPKAHVDIVSESNRVHNGDLVPLIKMMKAWNRNIGRHFRSFHLEVLALSSVDGVAISDMPSGVRFVLDKGRDLVAKKNPDPAGYSEDVGFYIDSPEKIAEAVGKFEAGYSLAVRAEAASSAARTADAIAIWRTLFGDYFPAYG
jgi:Second Messenger Oligonucleotide or Dinucleotide Synthetase domain